jgi:oxidase EvaA
VATGSGAPITSSRSSSPLAAPRRLRGPDTVTAWRFRESAATTGGAAGTMAEFRRWWTSRAAQGWFDVRRIPFDDLRSWYFEPTTGNLVHASGRFFSIEGLQVYDEDDANRRVTQPIIVQPEIGILGILVSEVGGVLHCLMQAKMEPGNVNTLQLSPTVQATRSNYTRVHNGGGVPYLEYFVDVPRDRVRADVLQSEQAEWFLGKRNRNIVVEVSGELPVQPDFCWLTLGQIHQLLCEDNLVNMDARTVLSTIPFNAAANAVPRTADGFAAALARSSRPNGPAAHTMREILSWFNDAKVRHRVRGRRIPLVDLAGWRRTAEQIVPDSAGSFDVIATSVSASNREVSSWTQPLIAPRGVGISAFLVKEIDEVAHILLGLDASAGYVDAVELGPTVQRPSTGWPEVPARERPPFSDLVLDPSSDAVRYDTLQSEEGGRLYHALTRYLVVEVGDEVGLDVPADFIWVTLDQLTELAQRSFHLNVQARTLLAALHALW